MADRHVSRWRLPPTPPTANSDASRAGAVSLRYLDEFVRKLQCAPRLLEHEIFPDAKEITESMGLFNAVRRYVVTSDSDASDRPTMGLADGIVVVGDGNTPRSAAMFAYRLKHWTCYSIDPAMETPASSARAQQWQSIGNLVVIRNKIENVQIQLRRAVVVLVHAHVTLEQALGAVTCDELVGVVTMPCCNWYGKQEELEGRAPSIVYDDFSILSDHRELRVWVDPRGNCDRATSELAVDQSGAMQKGCMRKVFDAEYGVTKKTDEDSKTKNEKRNRETVIHATTLFKNVLAVEKECVSSIATAVQCERIAAHIEALVDKNMSRILVLTSAGAPSDSCVTRLLLDRGFTDVFGLNVLDNDDQHEVLCADVIKIDTNAKSSSSVTAQLKIVPVSQTESTPLYEVSFTDARDSGRSVPLFDCVVDVGFIHRSLRNQPKKTCGAAFERLVTLALGLTKPEKKMRLITVSPRKDCRKTEFLANEQLQLQFSTTVIGADNTQPSSPLYAYACQPLTSAPAQTQAVDTSHAQKKKKLALALTRALENDFGVVARSITPASMTITDAKAAVATDPVASPLRIRVRGIVQHQRRFTTGPSFFSIAPSSGEVSFRDHLQVSMDATRLARWTGDITLDAVFRLLHKHDDVECIGEMTRNAQQQPMLQIDALRLLESEFQAYQ